MTIRRVGFIAATATTFRSCTTAFTPRHLSPTHHPLTPASLQIHHSLHRHHTTLRTKSPPRRPRHPHFTTISAQQQEPQSFTTPQQSKEAQVALQSRDWNCVKVVENSKACEDHQYIVVEVGISSELGTCCDSYRYPGQYVKFRGGDDGKELYLSMACAPNLQGYFEFLVRVGEGNKWFCEVAKGDVVEMSKVMGDGFGTIEKDVEEVLLFATGSGIAPIRACIESAINGVGVKLRKKVKLYYGARYPSRMAFKDRLGLWEEDGVEVVQVMSRPGEDGIEWGGKTGYVQKILEQDGVNQPKKTAALLCGVKGMTQDVKKMLTDAGVPENRVLMNF